MRRRWWTQLPRSISKSRQLIPLRSSQESNMRAPRFLARHTPEAIGDYIAGPNSRAATSRTARFSSGLFRARFSQTHQCRCLRCRRAVAACTRRAGARRGGRVGRPCPFHRHPAQSKIARRPPSHRHRIRRSASSASSWARVSDGIRPRSSRKKTSRSTTFL